MGRAPAVSESEARQGPGQDHRSERAGQAQAPTQSPDRAVHADHGGGIISTDRLGNSARTAGTEAHLGDGRQYANAGAVEANQADSGRSQQECQSLGPSDANGDYSHLAAANGQRRAQDISI